MVAQVIHKRRMVGGVGKKRKVIHAVVQGAYRTGVHRAPYGDNRGAIDIDGAQVACELVGNELNAVAIKTALPVLCQRERPLALAIGDEHLGALQHAVALVRRRFVGQRRQRAQQVVHPFERAGKRLIHVLDQQGLGLLICQVRLKVVVGSEQLVLTLQLHATVCQFTVKLVEIRHVLGKQGRSAQQWKGTVHHIGIGRHGKGMGAAVRLGPQLLAHAYRHWL